MVIVHLGSGSYYSLSDSAARLWQELSGRPMSALELAQRLSAWYDVDADGALRDGSQFLAHLEREGLVLQADMPGAPAVPVEALAVRPLYAPPALSTYNDLQELFLLDPVHDVDPAQGWPRQASSPIPRPGAVRRADGDLLEAGMGPTIVLVHRDHGVVCRLDGAAAEAWRALAQGPRALNDVAILAPLLEAGVLEPAPSAIDSMEPESGAPEVLAEARLTISHGLAEQIRPWGQQRRPARAANSEGARHLCGRLEAWFEAVADGGGDQQWRAVAGEPITVHTPRGDACHQLAAALPSLPQHLQGQPPGLEVRAWCGGLDRASPRLANLMESLRSSWRTLCGPRGEVVDLHTVDTTAIFNPGPDVLSVIDRRGGRAWAVKLDTQPFPFWEIGSPFRFLLHDHFSQRGLQMVHAAAVGDGDGAVLVVGQGGSGKSTTALACAAAGLRYLSDDYALVDPERGLVHALYGSGKLVGPPDLDRLPAYRGHSINADSFEQGGSGKAVFLIDSVVPDALTATLPIRAIVIPRIDPFRAGEALPASVGDALEAIVPSTLGQLPGADRGDARRLEHFCHSLPVVSLALGGDGPAVANAVREVLRQCS